MKMEPRALIVVLLGSTTSEKNKEEFRRIERELTLGGDLVLSMGVYLIDEDPSIITDEVRNGFEIIQRTKIGLADRVLVVNVDGRVGEMTSQQIKYAEELNIPIEYAFPTQTL